MAANFNETPIKKQNRDYNEQIASRTEITRFRVFSRVRPFIMEELAEMKSNSCMRSVIEMIGDKTIILDPKENYQPAKEYGFDASLWSIPKTQKLLQTFHDATHETHETQLDVYNKVAKGCVEDAFEGFNSCILTYGQTGSGKTYTMMGQYNNCVTGGNEGEEGLIPRVCHDLFIVLDKNRKMQNSKPEDERSTFRVEVSFVEIYMEKVRDLLDPALQRGKEIMTDARIRQDPQSGPFVEGVTRYNVENWQHCCTLLERGSKHRTTCATLVHQQSSRSHAIFQLTIVQSQTVPSKDRYTANTTKMKAARVNLVDLAGSERGGMADYVKESAQINKSLLALRRVIDNLTERQNIMMEMAKAEVTGGALIDKTLPQVPFRDSVLTWLLSDSIGGNARTTMIATLSPLAKNYNDTMATLTWSSKARSLVTVVKANSAQNILSTKANELQSNLSIRQQTVDSLRGTLQQQSVYAENLEASSLKTVDIIRNLKADCIEKRKHMYAVRIQRAVKSFLHKFKIEKLYIELEKQPDILEIATAERDDQQKSLNDVLEVEERQRKCVNDLKTTLVDIQKELQVHIKNKDVFGIRKAKIEEQYEEVQGSIGSEVSIYQKDVHEKESTNKVLRNQVAKSKERNSQIEEYVELMNKEIGNKADPDAARKMNALNENAEQRETRKTQLDTRLEELMKKRDILKCQYDTTKKKHDKAMNGEIEGEE